MSKSKNQKKIQTSTTTGRPVLFVLVFLQVTGLSVHTFRTFTTMQLPA